MQDHRIAIADDDDRSMVTRNLGATHQAADSHVSIGDQVNVTNDLVPHGTSSGGINGVNTRTREEAFLDKLWTRGDKVLSALDAVLDGPYSRDKLNASLGLIDKLLPKQAGLSLTINANQVAMMVGDAIADAKAAKAKAHQ